MALKTIVLQGEQKRVLFFPVTEPILIKGVAGSGKTTVALYRAKHLLDTGANLFQEAKVAIFTYNKILVKYIKAITPHISGGYQRDTPEMKTDKPKGINVVVTNFHKWAYDFIERSGFKMTEGKVFNGNVDIEVKTLTNENIIAILSSIKENYREHNIANKSEQFFAEEISWMKGKLFQNKNEYIEAKRTGRGTSDRVKKADKEVIWKIFSDYNEILRERGRFDFDDYASLCLDIIAKPNFTPPYSHIIVDEAQDLSKAQLLVISKIVSQKTKSISIIADAAQRIYKSGFTWSEVGLSVVGRTTQFKKNYRNTEQIAAAAKSLLEKDDDKSDFTEIESSRTSGGKPTIGYFDSWESEVNYLHTKLNELKNADELNSTVVLHRNHDGIKNIRAFLIAKGFQVQKLMKAEDIDFESDSIKLCTMSSIKGLEFDNVFIVDLNLDVIPYPLDSNGEEDELHISTERRLLYTSMTRARERLYLLSSGKPTRYLAEIDAAMLDRADKAVAISADDLPF